MDRRQFLSGAAASSLALGSVRAADWPERLVKLVVPFPPAGAIDVVARLIAPKLQQLWGKDVVIENKPGAGGNIGNEQVARSAPDGYTLLLTQSGIIVNQFLYPKLNYDPVADFTPVSLLALVPNVMVVPASSPVKTLEEFVAYAKSKTLTYGSAGNGTSSHMCGEMFKKRVGVEMTHVPYRGSAPALNDLNSRPPRRDDRQRVRHRAAYPVRQPARAWRHVDAEASGAARTAAARRNRAPGLRRGGPGCCSRARQDSA